MYSPEEASDFLVGCEKSTFSAAERPQRLKRLRKKCLPRGSLTSAAKAGGENGPVIAALKRCATQNHEQRRVFPQPAKPVLK
jgi:hypothetical protein